MLSFEELWRVMAIVILAYSAIIMAVASLLLYLAPRAPEARAFALFAFGSGIGWGMFGLRSLLESFPADQVSDDFIAGIAALHRAVVPVTISGWIHLAGIFAGSTRLQWYGNGRKAGLTLAISGLLGTFNFYSFNYASWSFIVAEFIQSATLVAVSILIVVVVLRARSFTLPGTLARRRLNAYLIGFSIHDSVVAATFIILPFLSANGAIRALAMLFIVANGIFLVGFVPATIYGVLTGRILELDNKFRLAIARTIPVAAVGLLFLLITEFIEALLNLDNTFISVGVAAALVLAVQPLQRLATRMARRLIPNAVPVEEMNLREKERLYVEHIELAHQDGVIDTRESAILRRLAMHLELASDTIHRLHQQFDGTSTSQANHAT